MALLHKVLSLMIDPELDIIAGLVALLLWVSKG